MPIPTETLTIDRRATRHTIFDRLRGWIEEGILEPGEPIKDSELAVRFGVSRTPVREALQMLEQLGAVEMLPGRVTRVTEVSCEDVARLYAPLAALQALAAELATERATERDVDVMALHNERLLAAIEAHDPVSARDADSNFHSVLLQRADNPYLSTAIEPLLIHDRRLETLYFRDEGPGKQSYNDHRQIIKAVAAHDAIGAGELTRKNFTRFWIPRAHADKGADSD